MTRFFNAIATICVEYFGMGAACFSSEDSRFAFERDLPLANRILADIFAEKEKTPHVYSWNRHPWQKVEVCYR